LIFELLFWVGLLEHEFCENRCVYLGIFEFVKNIKNNRKICLVCFSNILNCFMSYYIKRQSFGI